MTSSRIFPRILPLLLLLFVSALLSSCGQIIAPHNPYEHSDVALDPANDANWPDNWQKSIRANAIFESFIRHAEMDPEWILLSHQGEAVYVRPQSQLRMSVRYQEGSNKVQRMTIQGPCEALSLRQYARCNYLRFDSETGELKLTTIEQRQNNMYGQQVGK